MRKDSAGPWDKEGREEFTTLSLKADEEEEHLLELEGQS